jgi:taurine dioxygenase
MTVAIAPLTSAIGAEVTGVDLRADLDDATIDAVRGALLQHLVLFFRDQPLEPDEQLRFAKRFGPVSVPAFLTTATEVPEVMVLDQVNPKGDGADRWHVDNTYMPSPPMGSILRAVELPPLGGDTLFASMYEAYEALSPALREFLDGLHAEHDITKMLANSVARGLVDVDLDAVRASWPTVTHPVVRVHPETGRRLLFVNGNWTTRIVGLTDAESDALLGFLLAHVQSPAFQCRFRWTPDAVAFWDNRVVQHFAVPDYHSRRIMHRVTIEGDAPVGP